MCIYASCFLLMYHPLVSEEDRDIKAEAEEKIKVGEECLASHTHLARLSVSDTVESLSSTVR